MRYTVVPWKDSTGVMRGFAIWDAKMSPGLQAAGLSPYCSLGGGSELVFMRFTQGWQWIADCMARGLDLEAPGMTIRTYRTGPMGGAVRMTAKTHHKGTEPLHPHW